MTVQEINIIVLTKDRVKTVEAEINNGIEIDYCSDQGNLYTFSVLYSSII